MFAVVECKSYNHLVTFLHIKHMKITTKRGIAMIQYLYIGKVSTFLNLLEVVEY